MSASRWPAMPTSQQVPDCSPESRAMHHRAATRAPCRCVSRMKLRSHAPALLQQRVAVEHAVTVRPVVAHSRLPRTEQPGIARPVQTAHPSRGKWNQRAEVFNDVSAHLRIDLPDAIIEFRCALRAENLQERFRDRQTRSGIPRNARTPKARPMHALCNTKHVVETARRVESFSLQQILPVP